MDMLETVLHYLNAYALVLFVYGFIACRKQEKRKLFYVRLIPVTAVLVFICSELYRQLFNISDVWAIGYAAVLPYVVVWVLAVLAIWFCFKVDIVKAFFIQSIAYLFQHITHNLIVLTEWINIVTVMQSVQLLIKIAIGIPLHLIAAKELGESEHLFKYKSIVILLTVVNISFVLFLNNVFFNYDLLSEAVHILRILFCVILIFLPFMINRFMRDNTEKEKLEYMLTLNNEQRRNSKENIESINRKCHDLKHQIAMLKENGAQGEFMDVINSLERDVNIYDTGANTGNKSIDILIKEKGLICDNNGIDFTYLVDGVRLSFIHKVDLYTMLGNALDNAIEATKLLPDGERVIIMNISAKEGITKVIIENSCAVEPKIIDGLPQTTKLDKYNHGFGVKSIKMIAEKYRGMVDFRVEKGRFVLMILFFSDNLGDN